MTKSMKSKPYYWLILGIILILGACGEEALPYEDIEDVPLPSANRPPVADTPETGSDTNPNDPTEQPGNTDTNTTPEEEEAAPAYQVGYYNLTDADSLLYARVWKDTSTLLSSLAHDHVLRAAEWTGTIVYNPGDLSQCSISFALPVAEMRNDEPAMREVVGLGGPIPDSDRTEIHEHMLSESQLNEAVYPTIEFASTSCRGDGGLIGELEVAGNITIRGVTQPLTLTVEFQVSDRQVYASGEFEFTHSDFEFEPFSSLGGALKNSERLYMAFDVVGNSN